MIRICIITAIMVLPRGSPGAHPDSFPTTEPFGFSAATYFVPMSALLGGQPIFHLITLNIESLRFILLLFHARWKCPLQVWSLEGYPISRVVNHASSFAFMGQLWDVFSSTSCVQISGHTTV